jgi:hypothetical protein
MIGLLTEWSIGSINTLLVRQPPSRRPAPAVSSRRISRINALFPRSHRVSSGHQTLVNRRFDTSLAAVALRNWGNSGTSARFFRRVPRSRQQRPCPRFDVAAAARVVDSL